MRTFLVAFAVVISAVSVVRADVEGAGANIVVAQATETAAASSPAANTMQAEEKMRRRFPQPVQVGDLIGLPLLDENHSTIGRVREVVRTAQGRIALIVSYGGLFGLGTRLVAVPIEVVGIAGRQLASLDMPRSDYASAPTWAATDAVALPADAVIRVALARS